MESVLMTTPPVVSRQFERQRRLAAGGRPCDKHGLRSAPAEFACMSLVATLICNPANPALDTTIVDGARPFCPRPATAQWLFDEVAVDIPFDPGREPVDDIKAIETRLREARGDLPIDIVVQPQRRGARSFFWPTWIPP